MSGGFGGGDTLKDPMTATGSQITHVSYIARFKYPLAQHIGAALAGFADRTSDGIQAHLSKLGQFQVLGSELAIDDDTLLPPASDERGRL